MIGLYIYLSGMFLIWCAFAYYAFIKREEICKGDILYFTLFSFLSYLSILISIGAAIAYYMKEHGDEVVFNRKEENDDTEIL